LAIAARCCIFLTQAPEKGRVSNVFLQETPHSRCASGAARPVGLRDGPADAGQALPGTAGPVRPDLLDPIRRCPRSGRPGIRAICRSGPPRDGSAGLCSGSKRPIGGLHRQSRLWRRQRPDPRRQPAGLRRLWRVRLWLRLPRHYSRFGYFGGYRSPFYYGWDDPFWGGGGVDSYTVFTSYLDLDIKRAADGQSLFEGTAKARSRTDDLRVLVPNLVEAMFTGFPGNSGEVVRITVPPPRRTRG
jgi:hypothetical protein